MVHPREFKSDTIVDSEYNYVNFGDEGRRTIERAEKDKSSSELEVSAGSKDLVLVIDDNPIVRNSIGSALELAGYAVCSASCGEDGLKLFEKFRSHLSAVVVDQCLPAIHGDEIVLKIHASQPNLPVILTSGYYNDDGRPPLIQDRTTVFLAKPFRMTSLLEILARYSPRDHN